MSVQKHSEDYITFLENTSQAEDVLEELASSGHNRVSNEEIRTAYGELKKERRRLARKLNGTEE